MAVTLTRLKAERTRFGVDQQGRVTRSHEWQYRADANDNEDSHQALLALEGIGITPWTVHPSDNIAIVSQVDVQEWNPPTRNPKRFLITVTFSTATPPAERSQSIDDPTLDPPTRAYETLERERASRVDLDGKRYQTTAKEPFEAVIVRQFNGRFIFERNERTFSDATVGAYRGKVNETAWAGKGPGTIMLVDLSAQERFLRNLPYFRVRYVFEENSEGWQPKIDNMGFKQLVDGEKVDIVENGQPVSTPRLLKEDGTLETDDGAEPHKVEFREYEEVDFNALNLPTEAI